MKKTAKLVRELGRNREGHAALYELTPPLQHNRFVVASAVNNHLAHETYLFPADADGSITVWIELEGSYRGGTSHVKALSGAGYETEGAVS